MYTFEIMFNRALGGNGVMIKRLSMLFVAVAVGLVGAVFSATPANALVEVYRHPNSTWANTSVPFWWGLDNWSYHDGDTFSDGFHLYDAASATLNSTPSWTCFYVDHHYSGAWYGLNGYVGATNLIGTGYDNLLSSHDYNSTPSC